MSKGAIIEIGLGIAAVAGAVFLPGIGAGLAIGLLTAGTSMAVGGIVAGIGELEMKSGGVVGATRNPIGAHNYQFGYCSVTGTTVFQVPNSNAGGGNFTSNNKQLHIVRVLNAHPSAIGTFGTGTASDWQVMVGGKTIEFNALSEGYLSKSPTQLQIPISSISRSGGLVTFVLSSPLTDANGTTVYVKDVADNTYNGVCTVTNPSGDNLTFTYVCGGADGSSTGGICGTCYADYSDKVFVDFLNGTHTSTFGSLLDGGTQWQTTDLWLGRTVLYLMLGWDASDFSTVPDVRLISQGCNVIYDPRTSSYGWTDNPALIIAYYLNLPRENGGFGLQYGTDINTAQLIAAANICDETVALAAGGTVKRYTCNGNVQVSRGRGVILQELLSSCAGRISFSGGQYYIYPGAWVTPSASFTTADFVGPIEFKVLLSSRDVANGAKGVYTSPSNNWQEADIPPYTQDTLHGYTTNQYLIQDNNEALYLTQNLPFTTDPATAQRILKIYMMRTRFQQRVTVRLSMKAFVCTPLDVIQITNSKYGWNNTTFEVLSATMVNDSQGENPRLYMQLDLALTDPSVYNWSTSEELSVTGYVQPDMQNGTKTATQPNSLTLYSGPGATIGGVTYPSTIISTASGVNRNSLLVNWVQPNDIFVTTSGHIEIQYQLSGASAWTDAGKVTGNATTYTIPNVTEGSAYNVQIRSINQIGAYSPWVLAGPLTVTNTTSSIAAANVTGLDPTATGGSLAATRITGVLPLTNLPTALASISTTAGASTAVAAGATAQVGAGATASVTGTGLSGSVTLTTGTGTLTAGTIATVTFSPAASTAPYGVVAANGTAISGLEWTTTTSTLVISATAALAQSTTYTIGYFLS